MRVGIVVFPGSNCDHDCRWAFDSVLGVPADYLWHKDEELSGYDVIVLPGGFSYGDYLRTGAIARFSPIMRSVERFAADGGRVLGICNGFQVLTEAGLLPGALLINAGLKFRCQDVHVAVERADTPYTRACRKGQVLRLHIAHYEGNYFAEPETIEELERSGRVVLRYCGPAGERAPRFNPNGSVNDIAGICSADGRVLGMMPHPERCMVPAQGSVDGRTFLSSLLAGEPSAEGAPAEVGVEA